MAGAENIIGKGFESRPDDINKSGRPIGSKSRATIARKWLELEEKVKNPITSKDESLSQEDIITLAQIKKARAGDSIAYGKLMDSGYGLPKQEIDVEGKLTFEINIV